jgi:Protein of unknown function (DUF2637)
VSAADRVIRVSTAVAVLGVAGIAAYVSYWHAFEVVRAHGESGITARLEPATIDGLVYSSSMVVLYAARHRLPVPGLARWLLAMGILATLAANVAHGWSHGPVGAAVAAWPAASLVGSYELLLWLIRTAAAGQAVREPAAVHQAEPADHPLTELRLVPMPDLVAARNSETADQHLAFGGPDGFSLVRDAGVGVGRTSEPDHSSAAETYQPAPAESDPHLVAGAAVAKSGSELGDIDRAVAAYRTSVEKGRPLSERKLAAMFGKTSRRWARSRMAEARQPLVSATVDNR